jgi:hypothetical protein
MQFAVIALPLHDQPLPGLGGVEFDFAGQNDGLAGAADGEGGRGKERKDEYE